MDADRSMFTQYYQRVTMLYFHRRSYYWAVSIPWFASAKPWVTLIVFIHFTLFLILLLPEGKFLNIIPAR